MILLVILTLIVAITLIVWEEKLNQTPPQAVTISTSPDGVEVTSRYVVETVKMSKNLRDAQSSIVEWITTNPNLRIVQIIPLGDSNTPNGIIIIAEGR